MPKNLRDRLAIKPGAALIAEEVDGKLLLRPAVVTPVRIYTEEEIQRWLDDDHLAPTQRKKILKKVRRR